MNGTLLIELGLNLHLIKVQIDCCSCFKSWVATVFLHLICLLCNLDKKKVLLRNSLLKFYRYERSSDLTCLYCKRE